MGSIFLLSLFGGMLAIFGQAPINLISRVALRGEVAFCSQECREHQIAKDELMEQNCTITSIREAPSDQSGSGGGSGGAGDAVAAA
ncbi:hypothetical protein TRIUR3_05166 [Triticum urartu]|uniref:FLZ-type domain-containing protein n=2 Tax=Triticum TaxID=4564 RepID=A0A9R0Y6Q7_TRITD|nr:hypothetical protein TRIUR3_05166 [Triticum urartu]VAI49271.1 unnamed protein product [Triticum turgidum subsp. durum]